ncbi:MAG TPA: acyltransferase [Cyclobacteriaceae bacterium]|jgi:peptidoglycan/LPS O-acetylase OafA/YrhL|nr:acyltransferase [Cyclobacteriaceae bacterium]
MKIAHLLNKENNNLDLLRIILSSLVIVGHSPIINGSSESWIDPISKFFPFTYSGALAVKLFFFISGLLVTNSLLVNKSISHFIISRSFRLVPALFIVLVITVFVFGTAMTNLPLKEYFASLDNFHYITRNILFHPDYYLPGLFEDNRLPKSVNGSLWTLNQEVGCYMGLLGAFLIFGATGRKYLNIVIAIIVIDTLLPTRIIFGWMGNNPEVYLLPFSFAMGAFFAVNAETLVVNLKMVLGLFLLYYLFNTSPLAEVILIITSSITAIYLVSTKFLLRFKPKYDVSYGLYLWGFLIQQTIYHLFGQIYTGLHCALAIVISALLGLVTYILVEKPCIRFGRSLIKNFSDRFQPKATT